MGLICWFKYCVWCYKYVVSVSILLKVRLKFMGGIIDYWNVYCYFVFVLFDLVGRVVFIMVCIDNYLFSEI